MDCRLSKIAERVSHPGDDGGHPLFSPRVIFDRSDLECRHFKHLDTFRRFVYIRKVRESARAGCLLCRTIISLLNLGLNDSTSQRHLRLGFQKDPGGISFRCNGFTAAEMYVRDCMPTHYAVKVATSNFWRLNQTRPDRQHSKSYFPS